MIKTGPSDENIDDLFTHIPEKKGGESSEFKANGSLKHPLWSDDNIDDLFTEVTRKKAKKIENEKESKPSKRLGKKKKPLLYDIFIMLILILIVISILYVYTGNWPPLVVVESQSMMHDDDSSIGVIDTGDIVLLKSVEDRKDVVTYVEGTQRKYETYDNYGDVIVFEQDSRSSVTIIHRAIVWVEFNGNSFDVPSLEMYSISTLTLKYRPHLDYEYDNITIDLMEMYERINSRYPLLYPESGFSGFLTLGDNNEKFDQEVDDPPQGPVSMKSVRGVARGEIPWFGLIQLQLSGTLGEPNSEAPKTSVRMFFVSIAIMVIVPLVIDFFIVRVRRGREAFEEVEIPSKPTPRLEEPVILESPSVRSFRRPSTQTLDLEELDVWDDSVIDVEVLSEGVMIWRIPDIENLTSSKSPGINYA